VAQAKRAEAYYLRAVKDYMCSARGEGGGRKCTVPPTKGLGFKCIRVRASEDHYMRPKKSCSLRTRLCSLHATDDPSLQTRPRLPDGSPVASVDRRRSYSY
jgi:hypothetical protein